MAVFYIRPYCATLAYLYWFSIFGILFIRIRKIPRCPLIVYLALFVGVGQGKHKLLCKGFCLVRALGVLHCRNTQSPLPMFEFLPCAAPIIRRILWYTQSGIGIYLIVAHVPTRFRSRFCITYNVFKGCTTFKGILSKRKVCKCRGQYRMLKTLASVAKKRAKRGHTFRYYQLFDICLTKYRPTYLCTSFRQNYLRQIRTIFEYSVFYLLDALWEDKAR